MVSDVKHSCSNSERNMMSRLSASSRRRSPRRAAQHRQGDTAQAHHPPRQPQAEQQRGVFGDGGCRRRPSHVPAGPITSQISSTMFSRLPTISRITGARTYCTPSSQPSSTSWPAPPEHSANESQENAAPVPAPRHCRRQSAAPVRSADSAAGRSLPGQQRQQQRLHKGARQRLRVLCPSACAASRWCSCAGTTAA